jgi:hypothetical protein
MHTLEEEAGGACMAMGADSALLSLTLFVSFALVSLSLSLTWTYDADGTLTTVPANDVATAYASGAAADAKTANQRTASSRDDLLKPLHPRFVFGNYFL